MKTTKEWIDELPEDIRERAYKYTEEYWLKKNSTTLSACLSGAFIWDGTPEKHYFWLLVSNGKFDKARELLIKNKKP